MASQERTVVIGDRVLRDLRTSWGKQDIVRMSLRALVQALHSPFHDNHGSEEDLSANDPSLRRIVFSYPAPFSATATKTDDPLDYVRVSVLTPKVIELDFDPHPPGGGSGAALPSIFWKLLEDLNVNEYGNPSGPVTGYPIGRSGDDILVNGPGHDRLYGGWDDDRRTGSTGEAKKPSYSSDDHLWGSNTGYDWVIRHEGGDIISGGTGNDVIRGYDGNDRIGGHYGDDRLAGYGGNDIVHGGNGTDIIERCSSDDILVGGHGHDLVYVGAMHGADWFCFHLIIGDVSTTAKMRNPKDLAEMGDQYTHSDTKRPSIAGEEHLRSRRGPNDRVFLKNDWSELWNLSRPIYGSIEYADSNLDG